MPPGAHIGGLPLEETLPTLSPAATAFALLLGMRWRAWRAGRRAAGAGTRPDPTD